MKCIQHRKHVNQNDDFKRTILHQEKWMRQTHSYASVFLALQTQLQRCRIQLLEYLKCFNHCGILNFTNDTNLHSCVTKKERDHFFFFSFFLALFLADLGLFPPSVDTVSVLDVLRLADDTLFSDLSELKLTTDADLDSGLMGDSDSFSSSMRLKQTNGK